MTNIHSDICMRWCVCSCEYDTAAPSVGQCMSPRPTHTPRTHIPNTNNATKNQKQTGNRLALAPGDRGAAWRVGRVLEALVTSGPAGFVTALHVKSQVLNRAGGGCVLGGEPIVCGSIARYTQPGSIHKQTNKTAGGAGRLSRLPVLRRGHRRALAHAAAHHAGKLGYVCDWCTSWPESMIR